MQNLNFLENFMIIHHFTKNVFKYSSIKDIDPILNETHAKILLFVYKHDHKKMSKINSYIGLQKGAFTTSVDILIKNGYVLKFKDEIDKRSMYLELTNKGIDTAIELEQNLYQGINSMFDNISESERDEVNSALNLLSNFCMNNKNNFK